MFNFYAMSLLLNVAIAIKNKNAVIEIPNMAVTKTLLTVKDVKDCSCFSLFLVLFFDGSD